MSKPPPASSTESSAAEASGAEPRRDGAFADLRLVPGHHLVPADGEWLLFVPDGSSMRLKVDDRVMTPVAGVLAGARDTDSRDTLPDAARDVLARFEDRGFAAVPQPGPEPDLALRVGVLGDGPIAEAVHTLLGDAPLPAPELLSETGGEVDPPAPVDLVVACAGWLPDARWRRLGAWCEEHSVAWHGCYAEGRRFYLGPYWSPEDPSTASYRDTRDRRLAADLNPDGLEAYWRHLDGDGVPPVPWPDVGGVAVIAGALVSDVIAVARGERPPSHGHQLAFEPATGRWRHHPVLPVPRGLMTESLP